VLIFLKYRDRKGRKEGLKNEEQHRKARPITCPTGRLQWSRRHELRSIVNDTWPLNERGKGVPHGPAHKRGKKKEMFHIEVLRGVYHILLKGTGWGKAGEQYELIQKAWRYQRGLEDNRIEKTRN